MASKPLSPQQKEAAALAAIGATPKEIADTVGVAQTTVVTWGKRDDYNAEVNRLVDSRQRAVLRRADTHGAAALEFLRNVMDSVDPTISWAQRLDAAKALAKRIPESKRELTAEPVAEAPRQIEAKVYVDSEGKPVAAPDPNEMLLEMYEAMARIEEARSRSAIAARTRPDDDEEDDEPRVIVGQVVTDEDDDDAADEPEPLPAPIREVRHRPVRQEPVSEREVERMLRGRAGIGGPRAI